MPGLPLDALLALAARASNWTRVVRRCAWCKRIADESGDYTASAVLGPNTIATDGICPTCAAQALSQIAARLATNSRGLSRVAAPAAS